MKILTDIELEGKGTLQKVVSFNITDDADDLVIPEIELANVLRLTASKKVKITGIEASKISGNQLIIVMNVGNNEIEIEENDSKSLPANRILSGKKIKLKENDMTTLIYDSISQRWRGF